MAVQSGGYWAVWMAQPTVSLMVVNLDAMSAVGWACCLAALRDRKMVASTGAVTVVLSAVTTADSMAYCLAGLWAKKMAAGWVCHLADSLALKLGQRWVVSLAGGWAGLKGVRRDFRLVVHWVYYWVAQTAQGLVALLDD